MSYGGHGGKIHDLQVAKKLCIGIYVTYNLDLCCSVHARARAHTHIHTPSGFTLHHRTSNIHTDPHGN